MTSTSDILTNSDTGKPKFTLKVPNKKLLLCPRCSSDVYRYTPDGYDESNPPHFKCVNESCQYVAEGYKMKPNLSEGPLGSPKPYALRNDASYSVVQRRRRTEPKDRYTLNRGRNAEVEQIPKLAGKPDTELEYLLDHAILLNLQDDVIEDDTIQDNDRDRYNYNE